MRVGFIGVGAQGAPIAHRIAGAGFDLRIKASAGALTHAAQAFQARLEQAAPMARP
jgi:3-hydroxyisobutyrate dehydrogenase-like beta-hydroxyacid dehydrogenase